MAPLQKFYTVGAQAIGSANSTINVTISGEHETRKTNLSCTLTFADGFFEPHSWKNYDPSNPSATSPAPHLTVDTHQFWAFPPLNNLSTTEILQQVCDLGQQIRQPNSGIPPTLVGEWSLSTGKLTRSSPRHPRLQNNRHHCKFHDSGRTRPGEEDLVPAAIRSPERRFHALRTGPALDRLVLLGLEDRIRHRRLVLPERPG